MTGPTPAAAFALPASTTIDDAAALAATLPAQVRGGSGVLRVDASAVVACDSATIALLLEARRQAEAAGRGFEVAGAPPKLVDLARLYGVDGLLALVPAWGSAPSAASAAAS
jgi:phospholipid transport system transporter-binding protein